MVTVPLIILDFIRFVLNNGFAGPTLILAITFALGIEAEQLLKGWLK